MPATGATPRELLAFLSGQIVALSVVSTAEQFGVCDALPAQRMGSGVPRHACTTRWIHAATSSSGGGQKTIERRSSRRCGRDQAAAEPTP